MKDPVLKFLEERLELAKARVLELELDIDGHRRALLEDPSGYLQVGPRGCPDSPVGRCVYDYEDLMRDACRYCGEPEERK